MRFWDTFKTALQLSERVNGISADLAETKQRFDELESQWTDVLDKLKAREERQRKRDQRALKRGLVDDGGEDSSAHPSSAQPVGFDKEAARALARARGFIR